MQYEFLKYLFTKSKSCGHNFNIKEQPVQKKKMQSILLVLNSLYNITNPNKSACFIFLQVMGNSEQNA